ncbi:MAG: TusE/DsrC/DsvC family sulfur relay protein [Gammaproteobacteria bacterium]|nr:TusE/DsrC/DsvC family sulfur relay protein [Gammaproteobacteria bacterium]
MMETMDDIMHPGSRAHNPAFPHAPDGWTRDMAMDLARKEQLTLTDDHWMALKALQEYFARHELNEINVRELHDALDEAFHLKGGIKYLYTLFPGGPVAQGCRLAGLEPPTGAVDLSFGSVV